MKSSSSMPLTSSASMSPLRAEQFGGRCGSGGFTTVSPCTMMRVRRISRSIPREGYGQGVHRALRVARTTNWRGSPSAVCVMIERAPSGEGRLPNPMRYSRVRATAVTSPPSSHHISISPSSDYGSPKDHREQRGQILWPFNHGLPLPPTPAKEEDGPLVVMAVVQRRGAQRACSSSQSL